MRVAVADVPAPLRDTRRSGSRSRIRDEPRTGCDHVRPAARGKARCPRTPARRPQRRSPPPARAAWRRPQSCDRFITRLYPSAMFTPARSCRVMMGRMPSIATASISVCAGNAAIHSTPSAFKIFAIAVSAVHPYLLKKSYLKMRQRIISGNNKVVTRFTFESGGPSTHPSFRRRPESSASARILHSTPASSAPSAVNLHVGV